MSQGNTTADAAAKVAALSTASPMLQMPFSVQKAIISRTDVSLLQEGADLGEKMLWKKKGCI